MENRESDEGDEDLIRIKFSDIEKNKPIKVKLGRIMDSEKYAENFLLMKASVDFDDYSRDFELSVPYGKFRAEFKSLPLDTQKLMLEQPTTLLFTKLDHGNIRLTDIQALRFRCHSCNKELTKDHYDEYESIVICRYCGAYNTLDYNL